MTGWPVAWACFLAWRFAESSQHGVVPHSWQVRRWTHVAPVFRHSAHSRRFGCLTDAIASMCAQCPLDTIRFLYATCVTGRLKPRFANPPTTPRAIANAFRPGVHTDTSPQIASREYAPGPVKVSAAAAVA